METTIAGPAGPIRTYLREPSAAVAGDGPWPGVAVVHDVFGIGDDIRSIAGRFATAGYVAAVPDLYGRGGMIRCVRSVFRQLRAGRGPAFDDIGAVRDALAQRPDCTGRVGIAGFCMGGGFALLMAARGFDASAPYYGELPPEEALDGACPIVASFGGRDRGLRGAAGRLDRMLDAREIPHDVREYAGAGHGFANRWQIGPMAPLMRVAGVGYVHDPAEDAWQRVLTFFATHLRGDGTGVA